LSERDEINLVEALVDYLSYEHYEHFPRKPEEFWVIDLTRCSGKREFELAYPELAWLNTFNVRLILGTLVHKGLQYLAESKLILSDKHNIHVELEFEKTLDLDGKSVTVVGRPDLTFEREDEIEVVVDIKCVTGLYGTPHEHHELQIAIYKWLSGAKDGYLLYVSPQGFCQRRVDDVVDDYDIWQLITEKKTPRYSWECEYCAYARFCSSAIRRRGGKS